MGVEALEHLELIGCQLAVLPFPSVAVSTVSAGSTLPFPSVSAAASGSAAAAALPTLSVFFAAPKFAAAFAAPAAATSFVLPSRALAPERFQGSSSPSSFGFCSFSRLAPAPSLLRTSFSAVLFRAVLCPQELPVSVYIL